MFRYLREFRVPLRIRQRLEKETDPKVVGADMLRKLRFSTVGFTDITAYFPCVYEKENGGRTEGTTDSNPSVLFFFRYFKTKVFYAGAHA